MQPTGRINDELHSLVGDFNAIRQIENLQMFHIYETLQELITDLQRVNKIESYQLHEIPSDCRSSKDNAGHGNNDLNP